MYSSICNSGSGNHDLSDEDIARAENFNGNYITILDTEFYPQRLKNKYKPPFILYYDGDIDLLHRVDANGGKNSLVFLHGDNLYNIPQNNLVVITQDHKVDICGGLKVWFNDSVDNVSRFGLVAGLCNHIVCTKDYPYHNKFSWFIGITVHDALTMGANVYFKPTVSQSWNNQMIKDGAFLIDCLSDLDL